MLRLWLHWESLKGLFKQRFRASPWISDSVSLGIGPRFAFPSVPRDAKAADQGCLCETQSLQNNGSQFWLHRPINQIKIRRYKNINSYLQPREIGLELEVEVPICVSLMIWKCGLSSIALYHGLPDDYTMDKMGKQFCPLILSLPWTVVPQNLGQSWSLHSDYSWVCCQHHLFPGSSWPPTSHWGSPDPHYPLRFTQAAGCSSFWTSLIPRMTQIPASPLHVPSVSQRFFWAALAKPVSSLGSLVMPCYLGLTHLLPTSCQSFGAQPLWQIFWL